MIFAGSILLGYEIAKVISPQEEPKKGQRTMRGVSDEPPFKQVRGNLVLAGGFLIGSGLKCKTSSKKPSCDEKGCKVNLEALPSAEANPGPFNRDLSLAFSEKMEKPKTQENPPEAPFIVTKVEEPKEPVTKKVEDCWYQYMVSVNAFVAPW